MGSVAVYNGFGQYESTNDGQKGITLSFGGVPFWLPYNKVTYFPDYTKREVDHEKSSPGGDQEGMLVYHSFRVSGEQIVDTLLELGVPYKNSDKGIIVIANEPAKRKQTYVKIQAGYEADGRPIIAEVQEIEPTTMEVEESHRRAEAYKKDVINEYMQSKRERMSGGHGRVSPAGLTKVFMDEFGVKDIDDVTKGLEKQVAASGMSPEVFLQAVQMLVESKKAPEPVLVGPPGAKPKPAVSQV